MKIHFRRGAALALVVAVAGMAGCHTTPKTAQNAAEDEYVYITVTGSNIPKKVRKADIASGRIPKDVQAVTMSGEEYQKLLVPGRVVEKGK